MGRMDGSDSWGGTRAWFGDRLGCVGDGIRIRKGVVGEGVCGGGGLEACDAGRERRCAQCACGGRDGEGDDAHGTGCGAGCAPRHDWDAGDVHVRGGERGGRLLGCEHRDVSVRARRDAVCVGGDGGAAAAAMV